MSHHVSCLLYKRRQAFRTVWKSQMFCLRSLFCRCLYGSSLIRQRHQISVQIWGCWDGCTGSFNPFAQGKIREQDGGVLTCPHSLLSKEAVLFPRVIYSVCPTLTIQNTNKLHEISLKTEFLHMFLLAFFAQILLNPILAYQTQCTFTWYTRSIHKSSSLKSCTVFVSIHFWRSQSLCLNPGWYRSSF